MNIEEEPKKLTKPEQNRLGRQVIYDALSCETRLDDAIKEKSISGECSEAFKENPCENGPDIEGESLDLTGEDLVTMKASSWNQALIHMLANEAQKRVARLLDPGTYCDESTSWRGFFEKRIHQLLRQVAKSRERPGVEAASKKSRKDNASKISRNRKYHRRLDLAVIMQSISRENQDIKGMKYWAYVIRSICHLTEEGMSDEEEGIEDDEEIVFVHQIDFRHPDFRSLFDDVDNTRYNRPDIFDQRGRKRRRRVISQRIVEREPPSNLPPTYLRTTYLDAIHNGERRTVQLGDYDYPASEFLKSKQLPKEDRPAVEAYAANCHKVSQG
ncbi:hypothetical protein VNI00_018543, partial [Paramarasmius palmivorus]